MPPDCLSAAGSLVCRCILHGILQYGGAVRATGRGYGYFSPAVGTDLGGGHLLFLISKLLFSDAHGHVEGFHDAEKHKGHDQEIDKGRHHIGGKACYVAEAIGSRACHEIEYGVKRLSVTAVTILVNAPPMMTPTDMSMTFPRRAKLLNSSINFFI